MDRLGLSKKLIRALKRAGIQTLDELRSHSPYELSLLQGVGSASLSELLEALKTNGLEDRLDCNLRIMQIAQDILKHKEEISKLEQEAAVIRSGVRGPKDGNTRIQK